MKVRGIEIEDFINYKSPSMFIAIGICDWKCCVEGGFDTSVCQNSSLAQAKEQDVDITFIYNNYMCNPITEAIVIGGLEPFTQFKDIFNLIKYFRENHCNDKFIIYTGYYPNEIKEEINSLKQFDNIIIKFGRYIPNRTEKFDKILGIKLASDNQYACYINEI